MTPVSRSSKNRKRDSNAMSIVSKPTTVLIVVAFLVLLRDGVEVFGPLRLLLRQAAIGWDGSDPIRTGWPNLD